MVSKILLCTDGSEHSSVAAEYAFLLARNLHAEVEALHVIDIRLMEGPYIADLGGAIGAEPYMALTPRIQEIQKEKACMIMDMLHERFHHPFLPIIKTGALVPTILECEAKSDLVVLGKRGEHARYDSAIIGSSVEWLARRSVKPCLVTPDTFRPVRSVVAGFDGSSHAEKALRLALDLVASLSLPLEIACVAPDHDHSPAWQKILDEGLKIAEERGVKATPALLHGHADARLVEHCSEIHADLLIIGAYGHTRIREFLLGSTTFQILLKSDIPVYLIR